MKTNGNNNGILVSTHELTLCHTFIFAAYIFTLYHCTFCVMKDTLDVLCHYIECFFAMKDTSDILCHCIECFFAMKDTLDVLCHYIANFVP